MTTILTRQNEDGRPWSAHLLRGWRTMDRAQAIPYRPAVYKVTVKGNPADLARDQITVVLPATWQDIAERFPELGLPEGTSTAGQANWIINRVDTLFTGGIHTMLSLLILDSDGGQLPAGTPLVFHAQSAHGGEPDRLIAGRLRGKPSDLAAFKNGPHGWRLYVLPQPPFRVGPAELEALQHFFPELRTMLADVPQGTSAGILYVRLTRYLEANVVEAVRALADDENKPPEGDPGVDPGPGDPGVDPGPAGLHQDRLIEESFLDWVEREAGSRARSGVESEGIESVEALVAFGDLTELPGVGAKTAEKLKAALDALYAQD